ncbi:MAG: hypothetical protein KAT75_02590 [Dehalococcoidia bacterium]|nr:hypothetical protein [Dehalococcoidia bacterium]
MKLDGKKKWTAALVAIAGTVVAQFAPEQESAIMETVQTMAPMLIGGIYIIMQWMHDDKKETVKVEHEKTEQVKAQSLTSSRITSGQADILEEVQAEIFYEPFDQETFEKKVIARSKAAYFVDNPLTQFQAARDKALIATSRNVDKAKSYWYYYVKKGLAAFEFLFGFPYAQASENLTLQGKTGKSCTVPDLDFLALELGEGHYKLLGALKAAQRNLDQVSQLEQDMVAWVHPQSGAPQRWTLWTLGTHAKEILTHNI